jgi:peptide deformylase
VALREVLRYPHPALKRRAVALDLAAPGQLARAAALASDLLDTMRAFPGCVGLAAPQLDEEVRVVAIDVTGHRKTSVCHGELVLVNPRVIRQRGSEIGREGCLSIPELTANVRRAIAVTIAAQAPDGVQLEIATEGFEARCLQHELDHLDGLLFLDRVESLTDDVFRRRPAKPQPHPGAEG